MKPIDILGLKNFRIFDKEAGFFEELASINILTGANNVGKSSVIKALQMLKNSVNSNLYPFDLDLTEQEHLLGDFSNLLNDKEDNEIAVSLPFAFLGLPKLYISLTFSVLPNDTYKGKLRKIEVVDHLDQSVLFSFFYREATEVEKIADDVEFQQRLVQYQAEEEQRQLITDPFLRGFYMEPHENSLTGYVEYTLNDTKLHAYLDKLYKFYTRYLQSGKSNSWLNQRDKEAKSKSVHFNPSVFINSFIGSINLEKWQDFTDNRLGQTVRTGKVKIGERDFDREDYFFPVPTIEALLFSSTLDILQNCYAWVDLDKNKMEYNVIKSLFKNSWTGLSQRMLSINYFSAIREQNSRVYNAAANSPFTDLLKQYYQIQDEFSDFTDKYLKKFHIGNSVKVKMNLSHQLIYVTITTFDGSKREMVDFGYGIKQLILILLQIAVLAKKNGRITEEFEDFGEYIKEYHEPSILLIEEPETNLHPKWQSLLAEMFTEASEKFDIQLMIETHSEYLIRKLQTLVADKKIEKEKIKLFYLRDKRNVSDSTRQVEAIQLKDDGSLDYTLFDSGFFDEADQSELSLLNIQRNNFMREFGSLKINQAENETKIQALQQSIEEYANKADITVYKQIIEDRFDILKLSDKTVIYLASGQFLLHNIDNTSDFSPVILQYGRALESELKNVFLTVSSTKKWMLGVMQGSLEAFKFSTSRLESCNPNEMNILSNELNTLFGNPLQLKIELLQTLRETRNLAGHAGAVKSRDDALSYISIVNEFFDEWISQKTVI